jgi:pilus assembly protein Flp/PilA
MAMRLISSAAANVRLTAGRMVHDLRGATAIEYGLILAGLVIVMIVGLTILADANTSIWNMISSKVVAAH